VADSWCSAFVFRFVHKILVISFKGDPYPAICAQRTLGAEDFLLLETREVWMTNGMRG
jgi:hypothetical protein